MACAAWNWHQKSCHTTFYPIKTWHKGHECNSSYARIYTAMKENTRSNVTHHQHNTRNMWFEGKSPNPGTQTSPSCHTGHMTGYHQHKRRTGIWTQFPANKLPSSLQQSAPRVHVYEHDQTNASQCNASNHSKHLEIYIAYWCNVVNFRVYLFVYATIRKHICIY